MTKPKHCVETLEGKEVDNTSVFYWKQMAPFGYGRHGLFSMPAQNTMEKLPGFNRVRFMNTFCSILLCDINLSQDPSYGIHLVFILSMMLRRQQCSNGHSISLLKYKLNTSI